MKIFETKLSDVKIIEPEVFRDDRGFFYESFNHQNFEEILNLDLNFVQDNHSRSSKNILRGLHYQLPPYGQGKLVRVVSGEVLDIIVDIRQSSPTFGEWVAEILSAENKKQLWIPEGFAHGFLTLSDTADFLYKTTNYFMPKYERCIKWDDPNLAIILGEQDHNDIRISNKDSLGKKLCESEVFD